MCSSQLALHPRKWDVVLAKFKKACLYVDILLDGNNYISKLAGQSKIPIILGKLTEALINDIKKNYSELCLLIDIELGAKGIIQLEIYLLRPKHLKHLPVQEEQADIFEAIYQMLDGFDVGYEAHAGIVYHLKANYSIEENCFEFIYLGVGKAHRRNAICKQMSCNILALLRDELQIDFLVKSTNVVQVGTLAFFLGSGEAAYKYLKENDIKAIDGELYPEEDLGFSVPVDQLLCLHKILGLSKGGGPTREDESLTGFYKPSRYTK